MKWLLVLIVTSHGAENPVEVTSIGSFEVREICEINGFKLTEALPKSDDLSATFTCLQQSR